MEDKKVEVPISQEPADSMKAAGQEEHANRRMRRETDRDMRLNQLAEMGKLAAGLAHELKNPLSTLKLNLQLLLEDLAELPGGERARNRAGTLFRVAERLTLTLDDFLRYAGRIELRLEKVSINVIVQDLVDFLLPQAQEAKVRIHTALTPSVPECRLDTHLIKQALFNLLINAIQAMPQGGDLIIRTHYDSTRAFLDISDTGVGIPQEQIERIFEAYFTTKKGGTGLGLPTARRLIEEHGGHIAVSSEPGRGTNFRVELPLAELQEEERGA